jgi:hypothetical protein
MSYVLGWFTSTVVKLFGLNPFWLFYLGTIIGILGVILISSDKQGVIATAIATVRVLAGKPRSTIKYSVGTWRKFGVVVLIIGIVLGAVAVDAMQTNPIYYLASGGPALYHCSDFFNIVCWNGNAGSNITAFVCEPSNNCVQDTNSTLCTTNTGLCGSVGFTVSNAAAMPQVIGASLTVTINYVSRAGFSGPFTETISTCSWELSCSTNDITFVSNGNLTNTLTVSPGSPNSDQIYYSMGSGGDTIPPAGFDASFLITVSYGSTTETYTVVFAVVTFLTCKLLNVGNVVVTGTSLATVKACTMPSGVATQVGDVILMGVTFQYATNSSTVSANFAWNVPGDGSTSTSWNILPGNTNNGILTLTYRYNIMQSGSRVFNWQADVTGAHMQITLSHIDLWAEDLSTLLPPVSQ